MAKIQKVEVTLLSPGGILATTTYEDYGKKTFKCSYFDFLNFLAENNIKEFYFKGGRNKKIFNQQILELLNDGFSITKTSNPKFEYYGEIYETRK